MRISLYATIVCFTVSLTVHGQIDHWESVVLPGDTWTYQVPTTQPASNWVQSGFDDSGWSQ
ncbi:MAG: hypothetical protein RJQ14_04655, partial [Marinoscillum sp.]